LPVGVWGVMQPQVDWGFVYLLSILRQVDGLRGGSEVVVEQASGE
jgi:hypothetical protein